MKNKHFYKKLKKDYSHILKYKDFIFFLINTKIGYKALKYCIINDVKISIINSLENMGGTFNFVYNEISLLETDPLTMAATFIHEVTHAQQEHNNPFRLFIFRHDDKYNLRHHLIYDEVSAYSQEVKSTKKLFKIAKKYYDSYQISHKTTQMLKIKDISDITSFMKKSTFKYYEQFDRMEYIFEKYKEDLDCKDHIEEILSSNDMSYKLSKVGELNTLILSKESKDTVAVVG